MLSLFYTLHKSLQDTVDLVSLLQQLLGSGFQLQTLTFLCVLELFPVSTTNFSEQRLTTTEPQRLSN
jgi:hypothetical protein